MNTIISSDLSAPCTQSTDTYSTGCWTSTEVSYIMCIQVCSLDFTNGYSMAAEDLGKLSKCDISANL